MSTYLEQCKELSLTARMSIALKIFETFCSDNTLEGSLLSEFQSYLWQWPLVDGPDQFEPWESSRPFLVDYGLGDSANKELKQVLSKSNVSEFQFRGIVENIVEILWGSFWGACENKQSLESLNKVIQLSKVSPLPNLTPFKFSRFSEMSGWGVKLTSSEVTYWRNCENYV